jgi:MFS family permease
VSTPGGDPARPAPWRRVLVSRWALVSLVALLYWTASHSLRPFVVVRLDELGATTQEVGLVAASYAFLALFLAIPGGRSIDRLGSARVLKVALGAMAALGVAYAFAGTVLQLFLLQVVNGVVELFVWLAVQTLVTGAGRGDELARHLSLFSFMWGLGIAIGPTVGGLVYDGLGWAALALLYAGLSVAMLLAVVLAPVRPAGGRTRGGRLGRDAWQTARAPAIRTVLLSSFVVMYVISIKSTFYPLALQERDVPVPVIGVLLSVMGIASLAIRPALPALTRRLGAGTVLVVGTVVGVVGISLTPWLLHPALLVAFAVLTGAGYGSNPPVVMQLLTEHSADANRGLVMGLRATAGRLAQVVQPLAFGGLAAVAGTATAFPVSGAVLLAAVLVSRRDLLALRSSSSAPPEPDPSAVPDPAAAPPAPSPTGGPVPTPSPPASDPAGPRGVPS